MNEQKPRASTQFRRLGPLARGTALSNLGGSSPMNLFGFLEQLSDAMETDLAGESPPPAVPTRSPIPPRSNPVPRRPHDPLHHPPALRITRRRPSSSLYPQSAMAGVPFGHKDSVGAFPNHLAFPYDIVDKRTEYVITADIPGANRDMVEVSVDEDRVLHIVDERADRHEERGGSDEDGAKYVVYNRSFGRFERNFQLPQDVEDGAVDATMKNGVLVVRLPKKKETIRQEQRKNARRIAVKG